jgi:hypothetical protein
MGTLVRLPRGGLMAQVERLWRILAETKGTIEVRLVDDAAGDPYLTLEQLNSDAVDEAVFYPDVARALAQVLLEACEVASALSRQIRVDR